MPEEIKTCVEVQLAGEQLLEAAELARELNPENAPVLTSGTPMGNTEQDWRFSQALLTGKKWPQGQRITISFLSGTPEQQAFVKRISQEWFDLISLQPVWVDSGGMVRIEIASGGGSWSYLGPDCLAIKDGPTMRFGWLDAPVVRHEFGHMFGMIHEHQHPGRPWQYDEPVVYEYYTGPPNNWTRESVYRNVVQKYAESQVNGGAFDRESVMLYSVPNRFTIGDYEVGWNQALSAGDKRFISAMYPEAPGPPAPKDGWQVNGWYERQSTTKLVYFPPSQPLGSGAWKQWGWYDLYNDKSLVYRPATV